VAGSGQRAAGGSRVTVTVKRGVQGAGEGYRLVSLQLPIVGEREERRSLFTIRPLSPLHQQVVPFQQEERQSLQ
jgi:hypothetical protein